MSLDDLGQTCLVPTLKFARRLQKKESRRRRLHQNALQRVFLRLYLKVGCSSFYKAGFLSDQAPFFCLFAGTAETIPGVSGNEDASTGVETDGQLRAVRWLL